MTLPVYSVSLLLFVTSFCVPNEATDYYFSSFCNTLVRNLTIYPSSSGVGKTGYIRANIINSYSNGLDCTLMLNPPSGYGIELKVERIKLRQNIFCVDTITIERSSYTYGPWYTELSRTCDVWFTQDFSSGGPMRINFKTDRSSRISADEKYFRIFYSTYNKQNIGAIVGGVVGAIIIVAVVVAIVFFWRRRGTVVTSATTICPTPVNVAYPQQNYASPQPYGYPPQQGVPQQTHY